MNGGIAALARAEWLRLRTNRLVWLYFVALPLIAGTLYVAGALAHAGPFAIPDAPPEFLQQRALLQQRDAFPQSVLTLLDQGLVAAWGAALLASLVVGREFSWGTLRHALAGPGGLKGFVIARSVSLAVAAASMLAILAALGVILPAVMATRIEMAASPAVRPSGAVAYAASWFLVILTFAALGTLLAVVARSAAVGAILTVIYINGESFLALRPEIAPDGYASGPATLMPIQSALAFVRRAADLAGRVDPGSAFQGERFGSLDGNPLVPIAWIVAMVAVASVVLSRRNIVE